MILRRAVCASASLAATFRHHRRHAGTRTTTTTTTLWCDDAVVAQSVPHVAVEDMFGHAEQEEEVNDKLAPRCGAGHLASSGRAADGTLLEWTDNDDDTTAGENIDLCLDSVMNAALREPRLADAITCSTYGDNRGGGGCSVRPGDSDGAVAGFANDGGVDDDDGAAALRVDGADATSDSHDGDGSSNNNGTVDEDEDDEDVIAAEEEAEERVNQLLRASEDAEHTAALFFKNKHSMVKRPTPKLSFDDAAAEGAELESVGEVMPSPQRF